MKTEKTRISHVNLQMLRRKMVGEYRKCEITFVDCIHTFPTPM